MWNVVAKKYQEDATKVHEAVTSAKAVANETGFNLVIQPHLLQRLSVTSATLKTNTSFGMNLMQKGKDIFRELKSSILHQTTTKLCRQPFSRFTLAANGDVFPCCVTTMDPLSNVLIEKNPFNVIRVKEFRSRLLDGNLPEVCVGCTNAPNGTVKELEALVKGIEIY